MPRPSVDTFLDLDDAGLKARFVRWAGTLAGWYEVSIRPRRNTRSLRANSFYWAAVVTPFYEFLRGQDYDVTGRDAAHQVLRERFLAVDVVSPRTGEVVGRRVRSTTELTTEEFADYVGRCQAWLADFFGIISADYLAVRRGPIEERSTSDPSNRA